VLRIKSYKAYVDEHYVADIRVESHYSSKGTWYEIFPKTPEAAEVILNLPLTTDSIPECVPLLRITREQGLNAAAWLEGVQASRLDSGFLVTALLAFSPDTPGLADNAGAFIAAIGKIPELGIDTVSMSSSLEVDGRARLRCKVSTLAEAVSRTAILLEPALEVLAGATAGSVNTLFEFPPSIRSACEQYLLHFADFLRDLGVDTSVSLTEVANQVLFSVTPFDHLEALENVRIALDAYLHLPSAIIIGEPEHAADRITAYKLRANISHLQAQLDLSRAQNETLHERVQTQRVMIELLRHGRPASALQAAQNETNTEALSKYVSITDVEKAGVRIHLGTLLRDLKRLFRK
jgi:hypothetical protein